jgi:aldehyde:ferredoxin oxidoreductase
MANGYMGKYLWVDLTANTIEAKDSPLEYHKKFLGGSGIGTRLIWDHVKTLEAKGVNLATMDAFSADNMIVLATGPGTGITGFPSPSRYHVMCLKSPLTGSIASANSGGQWGAFLKFAGLDGIVIKGKASSPKYIKAVNGVYGIKDASDLWGKDCFETDDMLHAKEDVEGMKMSVACIGPPGEKLSRIACIINDKHRAAGRTGVGAVMGSKNLKGIVVGGNKKVETANNEAFREVSKEMLAKMRENGLTGSGLPAYGTALLVNVINGVGALPQNNWQFAHHPDNEKISGETLSEKYLRSKHPCWGCTIACGRKTKVDEGPFAIAETEGPEYESIWAFGSDCGVYDMAAVIMANHICDQYGLDTISMGCCVATAMELAQKGYMPAEDYAGIDLKFGSSHGLVDAIKAAGMGTGIGAKLAQGSYFVGETYGHPELSMSVKKLDMPAYDPRGIKGIGLNYATSNRGGCHVTGYTIAPEIAGLPEQIDRFAYEGKPTWVKIFQDFTATVNSTCNCLFTTFALGAGDFAKLIATVTGWEFKDSDVLLVGERIYNLQRMIMKKLGMVAQDTVPKRLMEEPLTNEFSKGQVFKLDGMLAEYYNLRGWDNQGVPTAAKIAELDMGL